jgi:SAM-dependent methyltransferase
VTEPAYLGAVRESYDRVAEDYVRIAPPRFAEDAVGRGMLAAFAELVPGGRPVADLGCGPGHVTAHLAALGLPVFGVDLAPRMVDLARRAYPGLRFEVGSMTALDVPDSHLAGIVAWWSIFHLPPEVLPALFAEFYRALVPGGLVLLGFHVGDEHLRPDRAYGHPVSYDAYLLAPDDVARMLHGVGLAVTARQLQEPDGRLKRPQACLLARKPETSRITP